MYWTLNVRIFHKYDIETIFHQTNKIFCQKYLNHKNLVKNHEQSISLKCWNKVNIPFWFTTTHFNYFKQLKWNDYKKHIKRIRWSVLYMFVTQTSYFRVCHDIKYFILFFIEFISTNNYSWQFLIYFQLDLYYSYFKIKYTL